MEKEQVEQKIEETKLTVKEKCKLALEWCKNHPSEMTALVPVMVGAVVEVIKIAAKSHNLKEEQRLKDEYIYDRSMGHYYELRRKPKSSELIEIDVRKKSGESLGVILRDMKLAK